MASSSTTDAGPPAGAGGGGSALADPAVVEQVAARIIGRRREVEVVVAALAAGRHVLLEGPPGTGKSTLLAGLASTAELGFVFVEGSAELTPARLVGHHDPSRVLSDGYIDEIFVDGPLAAAMRSGSLLYLEEINRIPEETLNLLVGVMSDGSLEVPRLGRLDAAPTFRLVAAMNPFDAVGTARISSAIYDRTCRVLMDYQSDDEERAVVITRVDDGSAHPEETDRWLRQVVDLVRRTRHHPDVRVGSSVRGAIDLVLVARQLAAIRGASPRRPDVGLDATLAALSGRIRLHDSAGRPAEDVLTDLWHQVFDADPATPTGETAAGNGAAPPPAGKAVASGGPPPAGA